MIEQIRLKRGLLRLREVTVAQLAEHTGVNPDTVKSFLHGHPDLVEAASVAERAGPAGPGRPPTIWKLRSEAEDALVQELGNLMKAAGAEFETERNNSLLAVKRSIEKLRGALDDLTPRIETLAPNERESTQRFLSQRAAATQVALDELGKSDMPISLEQEALDRAKGQLKILLSSKAPRAGANEEKPAWRETVRDYLVVWINGLREDVGDIVTVENWYMPVQLSAAPIMVIDGIAQVDDSLSSYLMSTGKAMGAPVLHVSVSDVSLKIRQKLFQKLASHLAMAAGATTQIVLTVDGAQKDASGLAQAFVAFERDRMSPGNAALEEPRQPALDMMSAIAPLMTNAGLSFVGAAAASTISPMALVLAGALARSLAGKPAVARMAPGTSRRTVSGLDEYVHSVCLDSSSNNSLHSVFFGTDIDYVSFDSLSAVKSALKGPLPLTAKSDSQHAVFQAAGKMSVR